MLTNRIFKSLYQRLTNAPYQRCQWKFLGQSLVLLTLIFLLFFSTVSQAADCTDVIRGPYLQMANSDSMTVRWRTLVAEDSRVRFGSNPGNLNVVFDSTEITIEHEIRLTDLNPNSLYYYSVGNSSGILCQGEEYLFKTSPITGSREATRIWIIGDSGSGNSNAENVYNAYRNVTADTYTNMLIMLGDNAYSQGTDSQYQSRLFDMYPELLRQTPTWSTLGNHDGSSADSASESGPYYDIFTLPRAAESGGVASGTEAYYSYDHANMHFIVLDSHETDRAVDGAMMLWLEIDLQNTDAEWIIAYWHHPPYTKGSHNSDTESQLIEMRENALPILESYGVDLVFSGHSHAYERSKFIDGHYLSSENFNASHEIDGGSGRSDDTGVYRKDSISTSHSGTVYVVAGSSGQVSQNGNLDHPTSYLSLRELGSVILEVDGLTLNASFIDDAGTQLDYFSIVKEFDAINPTITLDSPANQAELAGLINIQASANDNLDVASVEFFVDGNSIGADGDEPYSLSWNSYSKINGAYPISVTVTDLAGNSANDSITVTINNPFNETPVASNILIIDVNGGNIEIGDQLNGSYSYSDAESDTEGSSSFRWLRNGIEIDNAIGQNYAVQAADIGLNISFEVTPVAVSGASPGTPAISSDSDGDQIPDIFEMENGLDPFDPADALLDEDGDGLSNLFEYQTGTDINTDSTPPVISVPADITIDAVGLLTAVNPGVATANDLVDGTVTPTADNSGPFPPGTHTVTWTATDKANNSEQALQSIHVKPLVNLGPDQFTGEGTSVTIPVLLNGDAPEYPVIIPFTVTGTASNPDDHNLASGQVLITSGDNNKGSITPNIVDDTTAEGPETVVITIGNSDNATPGFNVSSTVTIVEHNLAPIVKLSVIQNNISSREVSQVNGNVTVTALVNDPNPLDTHTYNWSLTDTNLSDIDLDVTNNAFVFDPSELTLGTYNLQVTVTDNETGITVAETQIRVVSTLPVLSDSIDSDGDGTDDATEGLGDSDNDGIADYLDAINARNILPAKAGDPARYMLETEPGFSIYLGKTSFSANSQDAIISQSDVDNYGKTDGENSTTDSLENIGGIFDFIITDLTQHGQSVSIVLPQLSQIPTDPVYRKLMPDTGWGTFILDANNSVMSAAGSQGVCPPPGDSVFSPGLTAGHWCVQLTIEDGGPNDADHKTNSAIYDPGGVATSKAATTSSSSGSFDLWLLFSMLILAWYMYRQKYSHIGNTKNYH